AKKSKGEATLERIVAFMSLIMMMFDADKSDYIYKVLNKLRSLTTTIETEELVRHQ
nr:6K1 [Ashitaba mosaic virus]